jgi:DNA modification methylase
MSFNLFNQSNLEFLKSQPDNSIDSIVTDPPYGISFMGKSWDYDVPNVDTWKELMRVLKSGGHIIVACGTRTQHRMAVNIEDAGFEIRDIVAWVYGSGFPKSLNIGKAIEKSKRGNRVVELLNALLEEGHTLKELGEKAGIPSLESSYRDWTTDHKPEERSWDRLLKGLGFSEADGLNIIEKRKVKLGGGNAYTFREGGSRDWEMKITKGTSEWEGWGTALKPAMELWTLARKPLSEKTVAENVLKWGTGGINIDECRVESNGENTGRFPANFIHNGSDEVVSMFPNSGKGNNGKPYSYAGKEYNNKETSMFNGDKPQAPSNFNDSGSASRFFYTAKASKSERNAGLDGFEERQIVTFATANGTSGKPSSISEGRDTRYKNHHPTVKPVALMRYLARLITPKGGVVLDPYMGSGSTGVACVLEGFNFIGVEMDKEYFEIAKARIEHWTK